MFDTFRTAALDRRRFLQGTVGGLGLSLGLTNEQPRKKGDRVREAASITVEGAKRIGIASPLLFGSMLENWPAGASEKPDDLRNGIYGSVWVGEDSALANIRGMRKDTLEANRRLGPTVVRWPGGTGAGVYHWMEGIGPQAKRVPALATWRRDMVEPYTFGTYEFIDFCREIGAEPYINVNVGTGSPEEAANWVEYCNRSGKTRYAALRASNDRPEPFGIKYWGIGNELYSPGEIGHMNPEQHAQAVLAYAGIMRRVDQNIKIVAVGHTGEFFGQNTGDEWNRRLLETAGKAIDFISLHRYYHEDDHYRLLACPIQTEIVLGNWRKMIDEYRPKAVVGAKPERVLIAVDEWNSWHGNTGPYYKLPLSDGLFSALMFHVFIRNCDIVGMANYCNLVNSDPCSMIVTNQDRVYINPMGLAFELYRRYTGSTAVHVKAEVDGYDAGKISTAGESSTMPINHVPYLDSVATIDEQRQKLYLSVVNRHREQDIDCAVELKDLSVNKRGVVRELNAPDATTVNDFDSPNNVTVRERNVAIAVPRFDHVFPAHSATVIELSLS